MSLQSVGNALSLQQIMQMLQQQSLASADPEAAAADQAGVPGVTGQNLPGDQTLEEDSAGQAPQVTSAKATLDPSTIKTLLQIQEEQTRAAPDLSQLDPAQLQSILAAMTGSAASGNAIAGFTQTIMSLLGGDTAEEPADAAPITAAEE